MGEPSQVSQRATARMVVLAGVVAASILGACGERVVSTDSPSVVAGSAVTSFQTAVPNTVPGTTPIVTESALPTTTTLPTTDAPSTTQPMTTGSVSPNDTLPPPVPATEHQLEVLAAAFSMPSRPDLHDVPFGQAVTVGNRGLYVNVPIFGSWQYYDLDAQSLPGATPEASEAATRDLLARLGIDATGVTATFTPNGPGTDVGLAGCTVRFANDGRIAFAIGGLADIPA